MDIRRWTERIPVFGLLFIVSGTVGWNIPAFYDWTGADQSRPSPLVGQTALLLVIMTLSACAALPWLSFKTHAAEDTPLRMRFEIRSLLAVTAAIAVAVAAVRQFPLVASYGLFAIAFGYTLRFWIIFRQYRWQTLALLACMCLPFLWIVSSSSFRELLPSILSMAAGLPTLLPTTVIGSLLEQHISDLLWLSILLSGVELAIGTWIIRLGPRRTIAYCLLVLLSSIIGSFGLNAAVRI